MHHTCASHLFLAVSTWVAHDVQWTLTSILAQDNRKRQAGCFIYPLHVVYSNVLHHTIQCFAPHESVFCTTQVSVLYHTVQCQCGTINSCCTQLLQPTAVARNCYNQQLLHATVTTNSCCTQLLQPTAVAPPHVSMQMWYVFTFSGWILMVMTWFSNGEHTKPGWLDPYGHAWSSNGELVNFRPFLDGSL